MKTINELSEEQIDVINEYVANICNSSRIAEVFGTTEEVVKDAIDYCDFIRQVESLPEDENGLGYVNEEDYDKLVVEFANRILDTM